MFVFKANIIKKRFLQLNHLDNLSMIKKNINYARKIQRLSVADSRRTAVDIHTSMKEINDLNINIRTIRYRLTFFGLNRRYRVRKPLITKKNRLAQLKFAREHVQWSVKD